MVSSLTLGFVGSPGMPSRLPPPPPQRQGIKDTLHLFDLVRLPRLFHSVISGRNVALLFSVSGLKSLDISAFSFAALYDGFFCNYCYCNYCYAGEFLLCARTGNNMVYRHYRCGSVNEIKALFILLHEIRKRFAEYCEKCPNILLK